VDVGEVVDIHDGELTPTLENRRLMARLIREWRADIVLGHRPYDYHPRPPVPVLELEKDAREESITLPGRDAAYLLWN